MSDSLSPGWNIPAYPRELLGADGSQGSHCGFKRSVAAIRTILDRPKTGDSFLGPRFWRGAPTVYKTGKTLLPVDINGFVFTH